MRIYLVFILIIATIILLGSWYVLSNKQDIFDKGIDSLIENNLPSYAELESLDVNLDTRVIIIKGFKLKNPKGFKNSYFIEVPKIDSSYSLVDEKNILKGISLNNIELSNARIFVERDINGITNIERMESVLQDIRPKQKPGIKDKLFGIILYFLGPIKDISQLLHIDPEFTINNGSVFFEDYHIVNEGLYTNIENIKGKISLDLKKGFKGIDYLRSNGSGLVNAKPGQLLNWVTDYNPTREKLTMNNTFDIENVDFTHFEPYYDKYSPFIFRKGRASGRLVFNFDNGQIGSDNEIFFSGLDIVQKKDHSFNRFWPTGADDLFKYFSSESGDIVFDFKIKGPMDDPRFYLGSKTKRALAYMVFDKVAGQIFKKDEDAQDGGSGQSEAGTPQEEKTDLEKVIDILKGL
jgi:hypothetical protein